MDKRLYYASNLAIPLKVNEGHPLGSIQPNFLVINDIRGKNKVELAVIGDTICKMAHYKIVHREILEASEELHRSEEVREVIFEEAYQAVPTSIVEALTDYSFLQPSIENVNFMLNLFQFRGKLAGFKLIIDEVVLQDIIDTENEPIEPPTPIIPTPQ